MNKELNDDCVVLLKILYRNREDFHYAPLSEISKMQEHFENWINKSDGASAVGNFYAIKQIDGIPEDLYDGYRVIVNFTHVMSIYWNEVDRDIKRKHESWLSQRNAAINSDTKSPEYLREQIGKLMRKTNNIKPRVLC